VAAPNGITNVQLGLRETTAPNNIPQANLQASSTPTRIDLTWSAVTDNSGGSGLLHYEVWRNGAYLASTTNTSYADLAVSPSTNYTYTIKPMDFHGNVASGTSISASTGQIRSSTIPADPQQIGVRPLGAYWGAAGENIDLRSGNLNFTLPLIRPMGRGGSSVTFALNYNSQNWRKASGSVTKTGYDLGYGFGWRLMAGSILPVWQDPYTFSYYLYTDSTGAQYRLNVNSGGFWESKEGVYVVYDGGNNRLYFPDGSYWQMDCVTAPNEPDSGTRYPNQIKDPNGNIITVSYRAAAGYGANTSARIQTIADVRSGAAYSFTYDGSNHLTNITNSVGTGERFTFTQLASQPLYSPFSPQQYFGTVSLLQQVTVDGLGLRHAFEYVANNSGELSKVILPYNGELRWTHRDFTYLGGIMLREVNQRHLVPSAGAAQTTYTLYHDDTNDAAH
jgi:hypothetical protein